MNREFFISSFFISTLLFVSSCRTLSKQEVIEAAKKGTSEVVEETRKEAKGAAKGVKKSVEETKQILKELQHKIKSWDEREEWSNNQIEGSLIKLGNDAVEIERALGEIKDMLQQIKAQKTQEDLVAASTEDEA